MPGTVALILTYEPSSGSGNFPLARIEDRDLAVAAARKAIQIAKRRARRLSVVDPDIGKQEQIEAKRLGDLLAILLPTA
jgi:hypothetical protein